jgi:hypothetical protein
VVTAEGLRRIGGPSRAALAESDAEVDGKDQGVRAGPTAQRSSRGNPTLRAPTFSWWCVAGLAEVHTKLVPRRRGR